MARRAESYGGFQVMPVPFAEFCSETRNRAQSLCTPGFSVFWAASNKVDNFPSILSPPGTTVNPRNRRPGIGFWRFCTFLWKNCGFCAFFTFYLNCWDFWNFAGFYPKFLCRGTPTLAHKPTFRVLLGAEIQEWPTAIPESHLLKLVQLSRKASGAIYRYRALLISRFLDFEYTAELALPQSRFQYRVLSISRSHILRFEIRGFYFRLAIGELFISAILRSGIFWKFRRKIGCKICLQKSLLSNWLQTLLCCGFRRLL